MIRQLCCYYVVLLTLATGLLQGEEYIPQYYVTAITDNFFDRLIGLIGSIHKTNFDYVQEIAVFDLGISPAHKEQLAQMEKVKLYTIEMVHPDLLKPVKVDAYRWVPGWYAWKPVAIKQALDMFPYVLWIDSGMTVLKPLDNLFEYIKTNGYFLLDIGDDQKPVKHNMKWQTTRYLIDKFQLESPENQWILDENTYSIAAGLIGASHKVYNAFIIPMYEESKNMRSYVDDGTTPSGFGTGRHDQTLFSIYAHLLHYTIVVQDYTQQKPGILTIGEKNYPFYVTWNPIYVLPHTDIYNCRSDCRTAYYKQFIHYKPSQTGTSNDN